jgi:hypothetical protein
MVAADRRAAATIAPFSGHSPDRAKRNCRAQHKSLFIRLILSKNRSFL